MPGDVTNKDFVTVPQKVTTHEKISGLGHGEGIRTLVPALMCEDRLEPVNDWLAINFGFGIDYGLSETAPRLGRCEFALKEHAQVGGQELNCLSDMDVVYAGFFGG